MAQPTSYAGYIEIAAAEQPYWFIGNIIVAGTEYPQPPNPAVGILIIHNVPPFRLPTVRSSTCISSPYCFMFLFHPPCLSPVPDPRRAGILV